MGDISKDIQSTFPSQKVKALVNIKYTSAWIASKENDFFKPFGISPQQFNILRILRGAKSSMKVQTVKERMIERAPNATRLMDKLYAKQLIKRERCKKDRRVVYVSISDKGLDVLQDIAVQQLDFLNKLTQKEAATLSNLLDKIR